MRVRSALARIAVLSTLVGGLATAVPDGAGAAPLGSSLSKADRQLIAQARVNGETAVTLLLAVNSGAAKQVVDGLRSIGATVGYRDDTLGYIRTTVATGRAEAAAG